jgi:hypothetical protein
MKTRYKILLILGLTLGVLWALHTFWVSPFCYYTYAFEQFIVNFNVANIPFIGSGLGQTLTGTGLTAGIGAGLKYASNKKTELSNYKQQATEKIDNLSGKYTEAERTVIAQENELESMKTQLTAQTDQVALAQQTAQQAIDEKNTLVKQNEKLMAQLEAFNNMSAKSQAIGENPEQMEKMLKRIVIEQERVP